MKEKKEDEKMEIKDLKDSGCSWVNCDKKQDLFVTVEVYEPGEDDEKVRSDINMSLPFCKRHASFAMNGLCYVLQKEDVQLLQAPFTMIDVVESVFLALKDSEGS